MSPVGIDRARELGAQEAGLAVRTVDAAAVGGKQEEWAELDAVMRAERHTAVLIRTSRVYWNPSR